MLYQVPAQTAAIRSERAVKTLSCLPAKCLRIMAALKQLGFSIPAEVMVAVFDGTPQSAVVEPSLTTVQIPNTEIGRMAAELLLKWIADPERPFARTYVKISPVWRNSTLRG